LHKFAETKPGVELILAHRPGGIDRGTVPHHPGVRMLTDVSGINIPSLTSGQFSTVYNLFSLVIASMLFTAIFLVLSRSRVAPRYRNALLVSAIVCGIAAYTTSGSSTTSRRATLRARRSLGPRALERCVQRGVPLRRLAPDRSLATGRDRGCDGPWQGCPARAAVQVGPGVGIDDHPRVPRRDHSDFSDRALWGFLSTLPFLYILYVLFVELSRSLDRQPVEVQHTIKMLRLSLVGLWGIYPIAYLFPMIGGDFFGGDNGFVLRQAGYSLADIFAKAAYGLVIYKVAR
jgi:hypothetical protein